MTIKIELKRQARLAKWRWVTNLKGSLSYRLASSKKPPCDNTLDQLKREGIVVGDAASEMGLSYLDDLEKEANRIIALPDNQFSINGHKQYVEDGAEDHKDFLLTLLGDIPSLDINSPIIGFCTQPALLSLVNNYLGMWGYLRSIDLWMNFPTTNESAKDTQMWHCDSDDDMNVKLFIYLCDVDETTGPFTFIPKTHPVGNLRVWPTTDGGRATDEDMLSLVPEADWRLCTGPSRTAVLADTCGWHRGLKPTHKIRTLFTCQFTSQKCVYPRSFDLTGSTTDVDLSREQRYALGIGSAK